MARASLERFLSQAPVIQESSVAKMLAQQLALGSIWVKLVLECLEHGTKMRLINPKNKKCQEVVTPMVSLPWPKPWPYPKLWP